MHCSTRAALAVKYMRCESFCSDEDVDCRAVSGQADTGRTCSCVHWRHTPHSLASYLSQPPALRPRDVREEEPTDPLRDRSILKWTYGPRTRPQPFSDTGIRLYKPLNSLILPVKHRFFVNLTRPTTSPVSCPSCVECAHSHISVPR